MNSEYAAPGARGLIYGARPPVAMGGEGGVEGVRVLAAFIGLLWHRFFLWEGASPTAIKLKGHQPGRSEAIIAEHRPLSQPRTRPGAVGRAPRLRIPCGPRFLCPSFLMALPQAQRTPLPMAETSSFQKRHYIQKAKSAISSHKAESNTAIGNAIWTWLMRCCYSPAGACLPLYIGL